MTYAIAGVSGNTGSIAAQALLDHGRSVRVIVRDRAKGDRFAKQGAEVAVADLGDPAALADALTDVEGAYLLIPPNLVAKSFTDYQHATAESIARAIATAKTPHVVVLSSIGAQHAEGTGPIKGLHYLENRLREVSGTHFTFLRATYFMENLGASLGELKVGILPSFIPAEHAFPMIATVDIGMTVAVLLLEGANTTSIVELEGPTYSMNDAARALSEWLGKSIQVAEAPLEAMVPALTSVGIPEDRAELYREMLAGMISGHVAFEGKHRHIQAATPLTTVLTTLVTLRASSQPEQSTG